MDSKKFFHLSPKRQKFLVEYMKNGGNRTAAVIAAGYNIGSQGGNPKNTKSIASTMGANILQQVEKDKKIRDVLESYGITKNRVLEKMSALLDSTDQRVVYQIIDLYLKLKDEYPSQKLKLGRLDDIESILTDTDVKRLESGDSKDSNTNNNSQPE